MTETPKKMSDIQEGAKEIKCPVSRSLYFVEEFLGGPMCGRCFPCSMGSYEARLRLRDLTEGSGSDKDIAALKDISQKMLLMSMCKKGKDTAQALQEDLETGAFEEHVKGTCSTKECIAFIQYSIVGEDCIRCGNCQDACKFDAIIGEKQKTYKRGYLPFEIRQLRCTKCGECIKVCPTKAVVIVEAKTNEEAKV